MDAADGLAECGLAAARCLGLLAAMECGAVTSAPQIRGVLPCSGRTILAKGMLLINSALGRDIVVSASMVKAAHARVTPGVAQPAWPRSISVLGWPSRRPWPTLPMTSALWPTTQRRRPILGRPT